MTRKGWRLAAVAVAVAWLPGSTADASTYTASQCTSQQGFATDLQIDNESVSGFSFASSCQTGTNGYAELLAGPSAPAPGAFKQMAFTAPNGTRFTRVTGRNSRSAAGSGVASYVFGRRPGQTQSFAANLTDGSVAENFDTNTWTGPQAPLDRIGAGLTCTRSPAQGSCGLQYASARLSDLTFHIEDTVAPDSPQTSGSLLEGWASGVEALEIDASDTGAGVLATSTYVNGSLVDFAFTCTADPTRLQPCPDTGKDSGSFDVTSSPFTQGNNSLTACAGEYGNNPAVTCRTETVQVDTAAPGPPQSLSVVGGDGWRRDNEFQVNWSNPAQANAPIVGAELRLTGPSGYDVTTYHPGAGITSIDKIKVPARGEYLARVYLRDAAGNEDATNSAGVRLRFDDTIPEPQAPAIANGWIQRSELSSGYLQRWNDVPDGLVPPSGIAGYRVTINTNSDSDPCSGASDPRACGGRLTEVGRSNRSRFLGTDDLVEGVNFVHVVPVSGSGMRATEVRHSSLHVDLTDPSVRLIGETHGGWINRDVRLELVASDELSGMVNSGEFPDDAPPRVEMSVDGQTVGTDGSSVTHTVTTEGAHEVTYWARDLAGNVSQPQTTTVRIDRAGPELAFSNAQDPEDPDQLVVGVRDALSGVAGGSISYRELGGSQWKTLDTQAQEDRLVARVDSGDMRPGVTYEFRATATDKAGNVQMTMTKANGEPMRVVGPFRAITGVIDLAVNGKAKARLAYGKRAKLTGDLVTEAGHQPVAHVPVDIVETFAGGSKAQVRTRSVTTDSRGGFGLTLGKGPSRTVVARFAGDRRYLGTTSSAAKVSVRSRVSLKVPPKVDSDRGITFAGKVAAKGAKLGRRGKSLEVQVKVGRRWKAVGRSIRTNRKGRFSLPYRFTATYESPVTYEFRAVVLRERGFPYLPSKSRIRKVTVTP